MGHRSPHSVRTGAETRYSPGMETITAPAENPLNRRAFAAAVESAYEWLAIAERARCSDGYRVAPTAVNKARAFVYQARCLVPRSIPRDEVHTWRSARMNVLDLLLREFNFQAAAARYGVA